MFVFSKKRERERERESGGRFGLVSMFNGILTFVGYLMPKPSFKKNGSYTISPIAGGIRGFTPFPWVFVRK